VGIELGFAYFVASVVNFSQLATAIAYINSLAARIIAIIIAMLSASSFRTWAFPDNPTNEPVSLQGCPSSFS
jgi:hypothetical protein